MSPSQETQNQVVILGPTAVAITQIDQYLPANHQRWMRNGAFDEGILAYPVCRIDTVQPAFVGSSAVSQVPAWNETHVATHGSEICVSL